MNIWQPGLTLERVEKQAIEEAMVFYRGVKAHVAKSLGIGVRTLDSKLEQYESEEKLRQDRIVQLEENNAKMLQAQRGLSMEQGGQLASKQPVPMRIGEEVQEVPSQHIANHHTDSGNAKKKGKGSKR